MAVCGMSLRLDRLDEEGQQLIAGLAVQASHPERFVKPAPDPYAPASPTDRSRRRTLSSCRRPCSLRQLRLRRPREPPVSPHAPTPHDVFSALTPRLSDATPQPSTVTRQPSALTSCRAPSPESGGDGSRAGRATQAACAVVSDPDRCQPSAVRALLDRRLPVANLT